MSGNSSDNVYLYSASHVAPIIFSILVVISLFLHIYQYLKYRLLGMSFFMLWGGAVFSCGWILRSISTYHPANLNLFIAQYIFIYAGPPIYATAEYSVLGRLLSYVPMHTPLHPERVTYVFIYLGAAVEGLTAAGASLVATTNADQLSIRQTGYTLISVSVVLQGVVECVFIGIVALIHVRCRRSHMMTRIIRRSCMTLYGTSTLVLVRCIFRAIESFTTFSTGGQCDGLCRQMLFHEWYLYVFEALPMVLYTFWLNWRHPGSLLPREKNVYLDQEGLVERLGPGWVDKRSKLHTYMDPFDLRGFMGGCPNHEEHWTQGERWPEYHREKGSAL
ncbi:hypothetical protein AUEXF2481DRAFT_65794 [Aureobasidium subglaciale EXF-2481]|uniref:RTA1 domain protein n=1 Tax=Aureobasidium subglaciale (strain EXF-2481) TaxID=1043005 RepID=A0A074YB24_AURSE|nr:uncharacterized protein AUEXF2481DRAFT_65794 [Aureobasidium subglaciale EXF-2481]KAI5211556.1 hypothetical protein E4T38_01140 [Aureobasidium subglaciale]KAI5230271.1 hypothetical protein E4T40_01141 [Aureobasidium subglaciale]KAI5233604.1 hypothetical protein E4T41_01139 [Aureobasidium subglaciale]KAI5267043.1 hypothetical protein E4T46_01139 [Aureobasidium subglaciale]KEQ94975.1 hypothetical protein AUEXF2481DRAFT_65794 [Aureobasidium subglaciale EXF-2481]